MVAPHAGYIYSGLTAAFAYRTLHRATPEHPRRVILIGPSHRAYLDGVSVGDYAGFATPLGVVELDQERIDLLAAQPNVIRNSTPHRLEHSLEVHLPFLQETVGSFRLVPMVYGEISMVRLAELIEIAMDPGDLLVASSDLSHFHPYQEAIARDKMCHQAMLSGNSSALEGCEACGRTGMGALLELAKQRNWRVELADYRNSGDTAGDKERVVGYASYLFFPL